MHSVRLTKIKGKHPQKLADCEWSSLSAVQAKDTEGERQMAALQQITFKKPSTRAAPSSPSAQFDGPGIMVIAGGAQTGTNGFGRQLSGQSTRAAPPVSQDGVCICCLSLLCEATVLSAQAVLVSSPHMDHLSWHPG